MSSWRFTDVYGKAYPGLANSILGKLVFDITGSSPISSTGAFTGTLDLGLSELTQSLLALAGVPPLVFTGTVTDSDNTLSVSLNTSDTINETLTRVFTTGIPVIGQACKGVAPGISCVIPAGVGKEPEQDNFTVTVIIAVGSYTGTMTVPVYGTGSAFMLNSTFQPLTVNLSDLNFLVPGSNNFSNCFPATQLGPYYNSETQLKLLSLNCQLSVTAGSPVSVAMNSISTAIGIYNFPLYQQALYLDPLSVNINLTGMETSKPASAVTLAGSLVLCNYVHPGNTGNPDLTFDLNMDFPDPPTQPGFSITGNYSNTAKLPVTQLVADLLGQSVDLGIGNTITLEQLNLSTVADAGKGTIASFTGNIGMSGQFGIFETLSPESFSLLVNYTS